MPFDCQAGTHDMAHQIHTHFPFGYIYADLHEILLIILLHTAKYTKMCTFIIQDPHMKK